MKDDEKNALIEHGIARATNTDVPFFFKQWGGVRKKKKVRILLNKTWDEMPVYALS